MLVLPLLLSTLLGTTAAPSPPGQHTVLVMPLRGTNGVSAESAELMTALMVDRMRQVPGIRVLAYRDVEGAMSLEQKKMLADCAEVSCVAEIAGGLNADQLVMGTLGRIGGSFVMSVTRIRQRDATALGTWGRQFEGPGEERIAQQIPMAVDELFADRRNAATPETPAGQPGTGGPVQVTVVMPAQGAPAEPASSGGLRGTAVTVLRAAGGSVMGIGGLLSLGAVVMGVAGILLIMPNVLTLQGYSTGLNGLVIGELGRMGTLLLLAGAATTGVALLTLVTGMAVILVSLIV